MTNDEFANASPDRVDDTVYTRDGSINPTNQGPPPSQDGVPHKSTTRKGGFFRRTRQTRPSNIKNIRQRQRVTQGGEPVNRGVDRDSEDYTGQGSYESYRRERLWTLGVLILFSLLMLYSMYLLKQEQHDALQAIRKELIEMRADDYERYNQQNQLIRLESVSIRSTVEREMDLNRRPQGDRNEPQ